MIESNPIRNQDVIDQNIKVNNCLFLWIINNDIGAAIYLSINSLTMEFSLSNFIGCVSRASGNSVTISITSQTSTMHMSNIIFQSSYGNNGSGMFYDTNPSGKTEISHVSASGCWGTYSVIQILYEELTATDFNGTFNLITQEHVFLSQFASKTTSKFFNFYKNPTTIEYAVTSPGADNYLLFSNFIENSYQNKEFGVVHINYPNQITYVENCSFFDNTNYLFNAYTGTLIVTNIICDEYTTSGNPVSTTLITLKTNKISFSSPFNLLFNQQRNNIYTKIDSSLEKIYIHTLLFLIN